MATSAPRISPAPRPSASQLRQYWSDTSRGDRRPNRVPRRVGRQSAGQYLGRPRQRDGNSASQGSGVHRSRTRRNRADAQHDRRHEPRSQRPRPPAGRRSAYYESRTRRRHGLLATLGAHPRRGSSLHQNAQSRAQCRRDPATSRRSPDAAHPRVQLLPHRHHHRATNAAVSHRRPHPPPRHPAGLRRQRRPQA